MNESGNGARERAYRALRESEELHRITLNRISDAVFLTDDDGLFTYICPNAHVIFGYAPDEIQAFGRISGLLGHDLFDRAELSGLGEICNIERDVRSKSGDLRHLLVHVKSVSIKGSTVLYTCRDITERSRAQEELRMTRMELNHASRLALAGQLTASIAHDISQPLTAIVTNAEVGLDMLGDEGDRSELHGVLRDIRTQGRLAADVVDRMRTLVRKQTLKREALDLRQIAKETLQLIKGEAQRRHVTVRAELSPSLPMLEADRVSLQQVLLNLVLNAMDAMDDVERDERLLLVRAGEDDELLEISVSDSGPGIPAEALPRVFDPFFTTKREGIGLGLVIAKAIVEEHGGRIWPDDNAERGATFRVSLPLGRPSPDPT